MTQPLCPMPKAAQQLIDDAKAVGYEVKVDHWSGGVTVSVETSYRSGSCTWEAGSFHSSPPGRLGFHTTPGTPGIRFSYAGIHNPHASRQQDRYPVVRSVRQFRGYLGLEI